MPKETSVFYPDTNKPLPQSSASHSIERYYFMLQSIMLDLKRELHTILDIVAPIFPEENVPVPSNYHSREDAIRRLVENAFERTNESIRTLRNTAEKSLGKESVPASSDERVVAIGRDRA